MPKFKGGQPVEYQVIRHLGDGNTMPVWIPAVFAYYDDDGKAVIRFANHICREYNLKEQLLKLPTLANIR